jgi:hypothetical protein
MRTYRSLAVLRQRKATNHNIVQHRAGSGPNDIGWVHGFHDARQPMAAESLEDA